MAKLSMWTLLLMILATGAIPVAAEDGRASMTHVVFDLESGLPVFLTEWKYHSGDSADWAAGGYDDASWDRQTLEDAWNGEGFFWLRRDMVLGGETDGTRVPAITAFNMPMAFEAYWDGALVGKNGKVGGSRDGETPGAVRSLIPIGRELATPGRHVLALRVSHHRPIRKGMYSGIALGYADGIRFYIETVLDQHLVYLGLYFIASLLCFMLYSGGWRHPSFLWFGAFTVFEVTVHGWIYLIESAGVSVALFQWVEPVLYFGSTLSALLLAAFLLWTFEVPGRRFHALGLLFLLAVFHVIGMDDDWRETLSGLFFLTWAFGMALSRWKSRQPGGGFALAGIVLLLIFRLTLFLGGLFEFIPRLPVLVHFIVNVVFVALIVGSIGLRILAHYRAYRIVELRAEGLEAELEKKSRDAAYLVCRKGGENHLVPVSGIVYLKAARVLVEAHLESGGFELLEKPLNRLETILPDRFLRIHRSFIVNIDHVKSYRHTGGSVYEVVLKDGRTLPLSRSRYRNLRDRLHA